MFLPKNLENQFMNTPTRDPIMTIFKKFQETRDTLDEHSYNELNPSTEK